MDTHHVELPVSRAEAVRRAVEQVVAGGDAVLCVGFDAAAVLDDVSDLLAERYLRVLRCGASGQGGLSLSGVLAQITERPDLDGHDDEVLQRGFQALTTPGEGYTGVVLLIDGAAALQRSALRYLQFIGQTAPGPRFVLASEEGLPDFHDADLALLRTRLAAAPVLAVAGWAAAGWAAAGWAGAGQAGAATFPPSAAPAAVGMVGPVPLPVAVPHLVRPDPALPSATLDLVPLPGVVPAVVALPAAWPAPALLGTGLDGPPLPGFVVPVAGPHAASVTPSLPGATPEPAPLLGNVLVAEAVLAPTGPVPVSLAGSGEDDGAVTGRDLELRPKNGRRAVAAWAGVGVAMAACIAFGVALGKYGFAGEPAAVLQAASVAPTPAGGAGPGAPDAGVGAAATSDTPAEAAPVPGRATAPAQVAPQVAAPPPGSIGPGQADPARTDDSPVRRPITSRRTGAAPADAAPARARVAQTRDAEPRSREGPAAGHDGVPSRPRRVAQAADNRESRAAEDGRQALHAPTVQPAYLAPYAGGERRPIIGTFSTDQNGIRTFRFAE